MVRSVTEPVQGEACHQMQKDSTIFGKKSSACRNNIFLFFYVFATKFNSIFIISTEKL